MVSNLLIIINLGVVVHIDGSAIRTRHLTAACTVCGAADLSGNYVLDKNVQKVLIIYGKQHGIHAPWILSLVPCVDRNGIGLLQVLGLFCRKGDRAVGSILPATYFLS